MCLEDTYPLFEYNFPLLLSSPLYLRRIAFDYIWCITNWDKRDSSCVWIFIYMNHVMQTVPRMSGQSHRSSTPSELMNMVRMINGD